MRRVLIGSVCLALLVGALGGITLVTSLQAREQDLAPKGERMELLTPKPYTLPLAYAEWIIFYSDEIPQANRPPIWLYCRLLKWESGWNSHYIGVRNVDGSVDKGLGGLNSKNCDLSTEEGRWFARMFNDGQRIDPFDAESNIRVTMRYFAWLHDRNGSWRAAVRKYAGNRSEAHTRAVMGE